MIDNIRPKSFLIAIACLELLLGTFLVLKPDLAETTLAVLFLIGGVNSALALELRNHARKFVFVPTFFAVLPLLIFSLKALPGGFYTSIFVSLIISLALILTLKTETEKNANPSKSLFLIVASLISISIGLTFLLPFQANHPFLAGIKTYLLPIAIILLTSGSLTLKLTESDTTLNSFFSFLLSLPMFVLGIYFVSKGTVFSGFTFTIFPLMLLGRFIIRFYIKDQEDEHPDRERQLLNSYNRVLEYASLGSLLIFIISEKGDKVISALLILSFAAASMIWFHILPHSLLSKKQLFLWLNLYSAFVIVISLVSPQNNPFLLLFSIPIFIFSNIFGKREIIYPTLIGLLGITLFFLFSLFNPNGLEPTQLLTLTSNRYLTILCISYIARKISS